MAKKQKYEKVTCVCGKKFKTPVYTSGLTYERKETNACPKCGARGVI